MQRQGRQARKKLWPYSGIRSVVELVLPENPLDEFENLSAKS